MILDFVGLILNANTNDCMIVTYPNVGEFSHAITIFYLQTVDFASIQ